MSWRARSFTVGITPTLIREANKNFAPTFPFLDLAFGTFHMPKGETPCVFGIVDREVPSNLFGQLCYPFRRLTRTSHEALNSRSAARPQPISSCSD